MDKKIKISFKAIRNSAIALNIIALGIFLLLVNLYNLGSPFEIFGDFLVSVKFLPKWLSASVLLLGVIVRIADFIVITFLLPSPENKRSYSKKLKAVNFAGLITLPVWFWALVFNGFNNTDFSGYTIPLYKTDEFPFLLMLVIASSIICLLTAISDVAALTIPSGKPSSELAECRFIKGWTINFAPVFKFIRKHSKKIIAGVSVIIVVCLGIRFMPASLDNLFYIGDFETALIEKNTDAIKDAFVDLRNDKANGVTTIDKNKTCETMNFGYDGVTVTLYEIDESGNQFRYTMLGKRKWYMSYEWEIIEDVDHALVSG